MKAGRVQIEVIALNIEFLTLVKRIQVDFKEFNKVQETINADEFSCEKLPEVNHPGIKELETKSLRIVQILERAQVLVAGGATLSETLGEALATGVSASMQVVAHGSLALQEEILQLEEECQRSRGVVPRQE